MHLLLIRHGETDWNSEGRIQGHTDTPLNARGIEQVEKLAARLASEKIDAVYTSPLVRARVTADRIAQVHGVAAIPDERLKEKYLGDLEGITGAEFEQQHDELYRAWRESAVHYPLPGEETPSALQERVQAFLDHMRGEHSHGAQVAIVSHGGTLAMFLATLIGFDINRRLPFWFDNASISHVDLTGLRPRLRLLNDTCHLRNGHNHSENQ
jgi:2,3-bisphosphoglycerate-dependent phosphoglycerate mutase